MKFNPLISMSVCSVLVCSLWGCGGGGSDYPAPAASPQGPLKGEPLSMVAVNGDAPVAARLSEISGLFLPVNGTSAKTAKSSSLVAEVVAGVIEVGISLVETIVEASINAKDHNETDDEIKQVQTDCEDIQTKITNLSNTMGIKFDQTYYGLQDTTLKANLLQYKTTLQDAYYGSDYTSLSNYSYNMALISSCVAKTGYPETCTSKEQTAYAGWPDQQDNFTKYIVNNEQVIENSVSQIHSVITLDTKLFEVTARHILSLMEGKTTVIDDTAALQQYQLLEDSFADLVSYQLRGAIILANIKNYKGYMKPTSNPKVKDYTYANAYLTGNFEHFLREECAEFQRAVQFLAVNMRDYRVADSFDTDMENAASGLANDPVFQKMLARSKFVTALIMDKFTQNRNNNGATINGKNYPPDDTYYSASSDFQDKDMQFGFGLHGSIIVPQDYTRSKPVTLSLFNAAGASVATVTATLSTNTTKYLPFSRPVASRFPNTAFSPSGTNSSSMSVAADYNWLVYYFDFSTFTLPAGTYTVKFKEEGTNILGQTGPWAHAPMAQQGYVPLGTVSLLYYEPGSPGKGENSPGDTNARLAGYFSLYWPWGLQWLSGSPVSYWSGDSSLSSSSFFNYISINERNGYNMNGWGAGENWSKNVSIAFNVPQQTPDAPANLKLFYKSLNNSLTANGDGPHTDVDSLSYKYYVSGKDIDDLTIDSASGGKGSAGKKSSVSTANSYSKAHSLKSGDYKFHINQAYSASMDWPWYGYTEVLLNSNMNWNMQLIFNDSPKNIMDIN